MGSLVSQISLPQLPFLALVELAVTCWGQHICQASCHLLLLVRWLYCLPRSSEGQPAAGESLKLTWLFRFHFLPALLHASIYGSGQTR